MCELPLRLSWGLGRRLAAKFEAARQVYNACMGEALRRLGLVRQSVWFAAGRATPRQRKQERQAHFRAARDQHEFSDAAVPRYAIRLRSKDGTGRSAPKTWIGGHLGAHEVQTLATRAYRAANTYLLGQHGRPRFKGAGRLHSVEALLGAGRLLRHSSHAVRPLAAARGLRLPPGAAPRLGPVLGGTGAARRGHPSGTTAPPRALPAARSPCARRTGGTAVGRPAGIAHWIAHRATHPVPRQSEHA